MPYADLREFIAELDDLNEIRVVEGADWELEVGTICELNYERQGPALLFDDIKGYPKGYRILTNGTETLSRALCSLEFPEKMGMDEALEEFERVRDPERPNPGQNQRGLEDGDAVDPVGEGAEDDRPNDLAEVHR